MESKQQILELSPKSSAPVSNHKTSTNIEAFVGSSPSLIIHSHNLEPYLCRDGNLTLHLLQADLDNAISLMLKMQKNPKKNVSPRAAQLPCAVFTVQHLKHPKKHSIFLSGPFVSGSERA